MAPFNDGDLIAILNETGYYLTVDRNAKDDFSFCTLRKPISPSPSNARHQVFNTISINNDPFTFALFVAGVTPAEEFVCEVLKDKDGFAGYAIKPRISGVNASEAEWVAVPSSHHSYRLRPAAKSFKHDFVGYDFDVKNLSLGLSSQDKNQHWKFVVVNSVNDSAMYKQLLDGLKKF